MKKYIPYISLWSTLLLHNGKSNAPIERFFGIMKNTILKKHMEQKCSRVLRKIRKYVLFVYKEEKMELTSKKVSRDKIGKRDSEDMGIASQEIWQKWSKESQRNFKGSNLQKILNATNNLDDTVHPCFYSGVGFLNQTAIWYDCDECAGWVHECCKEIPPAHKDDPYFCKCCLALKCIDQQKSFAPVPQVLISFKCSGFFDKEYEKSLDELLKIEINTEISLTA